MSWSSTIFLHGSSPEANPNKSLDVKPWPYQNAGFVPNMKSWRVNNFAGLLGGDHESLPPMKTRKKLFFHVLPNSVLSLFTSSHIRKKKKFLIDPAVSHVRWQSRLLTKRIINPLGWEKENEEIDSWGSPAKIEVRTKAVHGGKDRRSFWLAHPGERSLGRNR